MSPNRDRVLPKPASILTIVAVLGLVSACTNEAPSQQATAANCANPVAYDPNRDYFPEKIELQYADGFQVEYHQHYKVVTVKQPWADADRSFQYVLVQCGTPIPAGYEQAQVISVPAETVVALSTTHLPHLKKLGVLDRLLAVSNFRHVNTPEVRQKIDAGTIKEVGRNAQVDVEQLLTLDPDLVMTFSLGDPQMDSHNQLMKAGLPVVLNAEYLSNSPLARAEWLKFTALFFNREKIANRTFSSIAREYKQLAAVAKESDQKPQVLVGHSWKGTWHVPGGNSYMAQYLQDAGASYPWSDTDATSSIPLELETVYERAVDANIWLNGAQSWFSTEDVLADDERYAQFQAFQNGRVYVNNARLNEYGGNDYWESGISNPDVVLADLIKILHPELLPEHELVYYQKIELQSP
ncbi:ABC transporter substrate-binding protein [Geitlerinema sp. PCC 9228]|uniref:ABC transporter substrate-binding protein n=1 Tax=Geitlerinema sp. PCC 9228 TaxID=111611 RepID=UPI0008F99D9E|nr:ABC transporter substrate-binding protein [Geitlerinema sp. PCC 9228]